MSTVTPPLNPYASPPQGEGTVPPLSQPARVSAFFGALAFPGLGHLLIGRPRRAAVWASLEIGLELAIMLPLVFAWSVAISGTAFVIDLLTRCAAAVDAAICGKWPWASHGSSPGPAHINFPLP